MTQTPAGWYDDPEQPGRLRYWDGVAWTEHRHDPATSAATSAASSTGASAGGWSGTGASAGTGHPGDWRSSPPPSAWSSGQAGSGGSGYASTGPAGGSGYGYPSAGSTRSGTGGTRRFGWGMVIGVGIGALLLGGIGGFVAGWFAGGVSEMVEVTGGGFTEDATPFEPVPGTFEAGGWRFDNVALRADNFGDFEVEADVTNLTGQPIEQAGWTVSVIGEAGEVLATLDTSATSFPVGATRRMTFIGFDSYQPSWSTVAFQVDYQD